MSVTTVMACSAASRYRGDVARTSRYDALSGGGSGGWSSGTGGFSAAARAATDGSSSPPTLASAGVRACELLLAGLVADDDDEAAAPPAAAAVGAAARCGGAPRTARASICVQPKGGGASSECGCCCAPGPPRHCRRRYLHWRRCLQPLPPTRSHCAAAFAREARRAPMPAGCAGCQPPRSNADCLRLRGRQPHLPRPPPPATPLSTMTVWPMSPGGLQQSQVRPWKRRRRR